MLIMDKGKRRWQLPIQVCYVLILTWVVAGSENNATEISIPPSEGNKTETIIPSPINENGTVDKPQGDTLLNSTTAQEISTGNQTDSSSTTNLSVSAILNRCTDFKDKRTMLQSSDVTIIIPGNLTNSDMPAKFEINKEPFVLKCDKKIVEKLVKWEHGANLSNETSRIKTVRLSLSGKFSKHFTHDGHYHDSGHYYKPRNYCVKSISDAEVELQICPYDCTDPKTFCIPKCCGVDEILLYWNFTCKKISDIPFQPKWKPQLYSDPYTAIEGDKGWDEIPFYRHSLNCMPNTTAENWPLIDDVGRPKGNPDLRDRGLEWKLLASKRPVFYASSRQWVHISEGNYCVDAYANWKYVGKEKVFTESGENHAVILFCPANPIEDKFSTGRAWAYTVALLVPSLFLLLTAIIHLLLIDKQHLHGLTVLCYSTSMFFMYIFTFLAHLVSIFTSQGKLIQKRGAFCMTIAIASHYFFMTTFTWLTIMNFDLWLTFRSMRPVSKISKRIRRFWLYFGIGFGLPAVLTGIFVTMNELYRKRDSSLSRIVVPDYAEKSCFVARESRGQYMFSIVAIGLSINTLLVAWTFYIFYEFRKQSANAFTTRRAKSDKYSIRLFIKLFCIMGVVWFIELLSWKYNDNGETKPWFVVILDCIMFCQAFAIFFIFCINRRTLAQLEDKYPCLRGIIGPIRKVSFFKASYGDVEMTTPGSTPRKSSATNTSIATKLDSTLPRKASSSSTRSGTNNSHLGKMESISIDSDAESGIDSQKDSVKHAPDLIKNT